MESFTTLRSLSIALLNQDFGSPHLLDSRLASERKRALQQHLQMTVQPACDICKTATCRMSMHLFRSTAALPE